MKILKKTNIVGIAIAFFSMLVMYSCTKDEAEKVPSVSEITLSKADTNIFLMNRYVTIKGSGFDDVQEVLFNDLETFVNPNYVTSSRILVQIPNEYPDEITNKISLITKSKTLYDFDFTVNIPAPQISEIGYTLSKNLITISGANLAKVQEVTIGGIKVEDYTEADDFQEITFSVPDDVPAGVINVAVVCPAGTVELNFDLDEAANPAITQIPCEWVDEGFLMQINGRNLALITAVVVNDTRVESGFVYNEDNSILKFPMPSGITPGTITVKVENQLGRESNAFTLKYKTSDFIFWDLDVINFCWGAPASHVQQGENSISGNYALFAGDIMDSWWDQNNMFNYCGTVPSEITDNAANYTLKFDINVVNPWSAGVIQFTFNDDSPVSPEVAGSYTWKPYADGESYTSNGWETISIPLTELTTLSGGPLRDTRFKFFTGGIGDALDTEIYVDNFRIDAN
jgi:hypothetical protein